MAQVAYNSCSQALELCPDVSVSVNNIGANKTLCNDCEDDFSFCFTASNTIWLKFTTNASGGAVNVDLSSPVFVPGKGTEIQATLLFAAVPCDASTYSLAGNCVANASGNLNLTGNLPPNQTFYVLLNGNINGAGVSEAAEFTADVIVSGPGVTRGVPQINLEQSKAVFCRNEVATFIAHVSNCPDQGSTFNWFLNGSFVAQTTDSVYHTSAVLNGDVLSVSCSCFSQCVFDASASSGLLQVISFAVDAGPDLDLSGIESGLLQGYTEADSFYWSPDYRISDILTITPTVGPEQTTTYHLTGVMNGCSISDAVTVFKSPELLIPNSFTPNGDGSNDSWEIVGIEAFPNCLVEIFDRWGQSVFATTGYNSSKAWDGRKNGRPLNESVYFYVIDLRDGQSDVIKGSLTLMK